MGGHHHANPEADPREDQDIGALKESRTPIAFCDTCGHLLMKLNKCRRSTYYSPNSCGHDRHTYEECQYNAYLQRVEAKKHADKVMAMRRAALAEDEE